MPGRRRAVILSIACVASMLAASPAAAQPTLTAQPGEDDNPLVVELGRRAERFLNDVDRGQAETAFSELLKGGPLADKREQIRDLADQASELEASYGVYRGAERIVSKPIGRDLVLMKYLYKCERFPIVWHFAFYRDQNERSLSDVDSTASTWNVVVVRFDNDLEALLSEVP